MGGIIDWFKGAVTRCETCAGAGAIPAKIADDEVTVCPRCQGTGIIEVTEKISHLKETPCDNPSCHQGMVRRRLSDGTVTEVDCPVCQGLSRQVRDVQEKYVTHRKCPVCNGEGAATGKRIRQAHAEGICPDCHGLGRRIQVKRLLPLLILFGWMLINPLLAVVPFFFGAMVFSFYAIRRNKTKEIVDPDELYPS